MCTKGWWRLGGPHSLSSVLTGVEGMCSNLKWNRGLVRFTRSLVFNCRLDLENLLLWGAPIYYDRGPKSARLRMTLRRCAIMTTCDLPQPFRGGDMGDRCSTTTLVRAG